jgi:cytochrome c oxidase subunit IV
MGHHHEEKEIPVLPVDQSKIKKIWMVAGVLALVTTVEYIIAFTFPAAGGSKYARIVLFILLTIAKAYYIMKEFMHLGHERQSLQNAIIFPLVFLAWLVLSQIMEAGYVLEELIRLVNYGK